MPFLTLSFPMIDPVLVQVGPLVIRWYAIAYIAGLLIGWRFAIFLSGSQTRWGTRQRPTTADLDDLLLSCAFGIILGGRLGYVIFYNPLYFIENPAEIAAVWHGGMSFHGGLAGAALAMFIQARTRKQSLLSLSDIVSAVAPIGLFFGRVANFINSELWGRTTDVSWGVIFPNGGPDARHPSQLYQAALEGIVLLVILGMVIRGGGLRHAGLVTGLFGIFYGSFRIFAEFFREPDPQIGFLFGGTTMGMLLSIPLIIIGFGLTVRSQRSADPRP
ncbi:MAG: prolipoprotein diacylglyceryl transferase [Hyphomicrobiales bacterium]